MRNISGRRTTISFSPSLTPRLAMRPPAPAVRAGPTEDGPTGDGPTGDGSGRTLPDGVWWPRSADPAAELPGLVLALQAQGPSDDHLPIVHIMLRAADWDAHPRRLRVEGPEDTREVLLSWFGDLPAGLLTAIHADGRRVEVFTVPSSTSRAEAEKAMELAAHPRDHIRFPLPPPFEPEQ